MKKIPVIIIVFCLLTAFLPVFNVKAESTELLRITSLRISPSATKATIYWNTNYPTKGYFRFGPTNGFGNWMEDSQYTTYHETTLNGLMPKTQYFFQLDATTQDNRIVTSDIYNFEALDEDDNKAPIVSNIRASFITGNTATFIWETNESSDTCVHYGTLRNKLDKLKCIGNKVQIHDITINGLKRLTLYHYRISSQDRAGNRQYSVNYNFRTGNKDDIDIPDLKIYEITPFNQRGANDTNQVTVTLKTNRPVEGTLNYGISPNRYQYKEYLPAPRDTFSEIKLSDLLEDQIYYYRLYLKDVLGKTLTTPEFSLTTLPINLLTTSGDETLPTENIFNINNSSQDFDHDGLTNAQEEEYNTDPIKADTDGDGYIDGVEVEHGFNPLGLGRLTEIETKTNTDGFAYGQPRLTSLMAEKNMANDLRQRLLNYFGSKIPKSTQHWYILVNAYIYGEYPIEAIAKAIKHSGKTVHPTIPWNVWQSSDDYKNYINK